MRRISRVSPMRQANVTGKIEYRVVKFYNDDVVQTVTFAYLIGYCYSARHVCGPSVALWLRQSIRPPKSMV